ncbi:histidine--tRNA ligase [Patescibacteria group bacterium]|nr:histidine--tRNA ligase [Patescibacteria group bacterium]
MNKQKLQPLKGFRDFLPEEASKRQYLINKFRETFELFGFEPLETPALEYKELLLGKYGAEADKLVYTFKDKGGRDVALRYDQTVPTSRILATYNQKLPMPWRRYQIQNVWRAEKPQGGRFREFMQCDIDIYGTTSPLSDAELLACASTLLKKIGFKKFKIIINDRNILFEIMSKAEIPANLHFSTIQTIDKLDKNSKDEIKKELVGKGLSESQVQKLFDQIKKAKPTDTLKKVISYAKNLGVASANIKFQPNLARGLDYYTDTIYEIVIPGYKAGSVAGGGRYDNLIKQLSGVDIPATGFAWGFDRIIEAMDKFKLFPKEKTTTSVLVSIFNESLINVSTMVVQNLRENGISTEIYPSEKASLKKQLKYADKKGIQWLVVIGPKEVEKNTVILKNLKTGRQEDVKLKNLAGKIASN